ncbi:hypothetical protein [Streptomyces sp. B93]|uniref:hypothetical protein n=1 Tax=Streptomyces sp. B93 TaxID=2824875 RepID=UPI001B382D84|nr:hypothetical protein [Streptomyces sp. B93]MBQ1092866.1 hypothetical protein [Streptomyces sp. B93]
MTSVMLVAVAGCGEHRAGARSEPTGGTITAGLVADLRKDGFEVSPGYPKLYTEQDCEDYTYPKLRNCYANNPAAPYVVPVVKSWPDEYVDPALTNAFGRTKPGYTSTYRLDPRDALVIYGKMPPPGRYMGLQTWEFSQHGRWRTSDYLKWERELDVPMHFLFDTVPPGDKRSERTQSVSALGDIVNNVVMERQSGYSFEKSRYFIVTPSATTDRAVRRALQAQGVPGRDIFTEQIPDRDSSGQIGPLGMGRNTPDFLTAFRYALPDAGQEEAAAEWRRDPPLTVMRVRAPASAGPVQRYGPLTFAERTADSETHLAGDLGNLVSAVCDRIRTTTHLKAKDCTRPLPDSTRLVDPVEEYGWTGPYCREVNMDCLGDQQDAAYYLSQRPLPLDSGEVYAVVNTLATETGNATYSALSVNDASMLAGVANVLDTTLKGSADGYAKTVRNTGKFFVHYFTRDCGVLRGMPGWPRNCTDITTEMLPSSSDPSAVGDPALRGTLVAGPRNYIKPGTERGPDSSKLLTPRVLTFTQPGK